MIKNWQNTRTSTSHNIYIVYKYIEKYLTLLDIREMHIKALNEILLRLSRWLKFKRLTIPSVHENMEQ